MSEEHDSAAKEHPTPEALREGVRSAISSALARDADRRGGRTGRQLALSGVIGVVGGLAVTWLVAAHPLGHHPQWHLAFYSTVWAGLLVVVLALALLDVRTARWPIGSAARAAVLALGIAGICGWICPDQHFLEWWNATRLGSQIVRETDSMGLSAFCFGIVATTAFALVAALLTLSRRSDALRTVLITSSFVALLQAPGVALQATDASLAVLTGWMGGTMIGSVAGVAGAFGWHARHERLASLSDEGADS
ncbi:MAG: hypothetical protein DCC71_03695 [Proteobacteria bacterium]|nr:MAG: hypothetical protein DCC71_03695 [Pseudomonadota bacterium]